MKRKLFNFKPFTKKVLPKTHLSVDLLFDKTIRIEKSLNRIILPQLYRELHNMTRSSGRSLDNRIHLSTASLGIYARTWVVADMTEPGLWQM